MKSSAHGLLGYNDLLESHWFILKHLSPLGLNIWFMGQTLWSRLNSGIWHHIILHKKDTLPSGFFTNHHTSGSPCILPILSNSQKPYHYVYFWWGLDIFLYKYHLIKIIQQCQDIGLIFSEKYIKILLLLATAHAKKSYFLYYFSGMYLFDWSINRSL